MNCALGAATRLIALGHLPIPLRSLDKNTLQGVLFEWERGSSTIRVIRDDVNSRGLSLLLVQALSPIMNHNCHPLGTRPAADQTITSVFHFRQFSPGGVPLFRTPWILYGYSSVLCLAATRNRTNYYILYLDITPATVGHLGE